MLDIVEKIVWGLGIGLVVIIIAAYLVLGAPSFIPSIAAEGRKVENRAEFEGMLNSPAQQDLRDKLSTPIPGGSSKTPVTVETRVINRAAFNRVANPSDALREAHLASSAVVEDPNGGNSLEISAIEENSLLKKLGFQNKDILDSVDGLKIDFSSALEANELYNKVRASVEAGNPAVITLRRNGKPMRIVVGLVP
ncbi:MAG: hypothetical protein ACKVX7_16560 [Planctomycetota bacterium]